MIKKRNELSVGLYNQSSSRLYFLLSFIMLQIYSAELQADPQIYSIDIQADPQIYSIDIQLTHKYIL